MKALKLLPYMISPMSICKGCETAVKDSLQKLVRYVQQYKEDREHYTYKMFRLKKVMLNLPHRNINLRVDGGDPETYKLIQELLKGIEFYQAIPGYFSPDNYGIFGNATLTAERAGYSNQFPDPSALLKE